MVYSVVRENRYIVVPGIFYIFLFLSFVSEKTIIIAEVSAFGLCLPLESFVLRKNESALGFPQSIGQERDFLAVIIMHSRR